MWLSVEVHALLRRESGDPLFKLSWRPAAFFISPSLYDSYPFHCFTALPLSNSSLRVHTHMHTHMHTHTCTTIRCVATTSTSEEVKLPPSLPLIFSLCLLVPMHRLGSASSCSPTVAVAMTLQAAVRPYAEVRTNYSATRSSPWAAPGATPSYPNVRSPFPLPRPRFRKTHIEWMLHHGNGDRLGKYGASREVADFEYADGTPASISSKRFAFKHHQDNMLVQLIRAGATVERYEEEELLPRIPGTAEQRDWDPEMPLFLEDVDEFGRPPRALSNPGMLERVVEERFASETGKTPVNLANKHAGEALEPNTMFATYDPAAFVSDAVKMDERKPFWSRRRWALNDNFMVPMSPKAKNTIPDE